MLQKKKNKWPARKNYAIFKMNYMSIPKIVEMFYYIYVLKFTILFQK